MAEIFSEEYICQMEEKSQYCKILTISRPFLAHIRAISGNLYYIYIPRKMEWFKFFLYCLPRPTGDYVKYQIIIRTLAGPCSGYIVAKLSGHAKAIFGPFNYSYTIRTCKTIVNGYCGIVW